MKPGKFISVLAALLLATSLALHAAAAETKPARQPVSVVPPLAMLRPWTGDWDGIVERRTLRVLVVYSRTFYFVDKGIQRGLAYDAFKGFEDDIYKYYIAYTLVTEAEARKREAREALQTGTPK